MVWKFAVALIGAALMAVPASAAPLFDNYIFGSSNNRPWRLSLNGGSAIGSFDTGWISDSGEHTETNDNYFAGDSGGFATLNNWGHSICADIPAGRSRRRRLPSIRPPTASRCRRPGL